MRIPVANFFFACRKNPTATTQSPRKPPRENVKIIATREPQKNPRKSRRNQGFEKFLRTAKNTGNVMFKASAKSLLSAINDPGGPSYGEFAPLVIPQTMLQSPMTPNEKAIVPNRRVNFCFS